MKVKYVFFMFVFFVALIAAIVFFNDREIGKLEKELERVTPPDTVSVIIYLPDTTFTREVDTVEVEEEVRGDTVYVHKRMYGFFQQPLFELGIWANSKTEEFSYDLRYRPLKIYFTFKNKYDLRKGFDVYTIPDIGGINVDWGDYTPAKKPRSFGLILGFGYSKEQGPFLLPGIRYKRSTLGAFLKEKSWGLYYQYNL